MSHTAGGSRPESQLRLVSQNSNTVHAGTSARATRIDAHHHVWDLSVRDQPYLVAAGLTALLRDVPIQELEPQAAACGIGGTVVVQTVNVPGETPELLALAATGGLVAGVVGWTDLTAPDVADRVAELRAGPGGSHLVGIRHVARAEADPAWLCRPEVRRGLRALGAAGIVFDLLVAEPQMPAALATVAALPEVGFVLEHLGCPPVGAADPRAWAEPVRRLAALPNVACKLSGMVAHAEERLWSVEELHPYTDTVLEVFGPERVMFGSDWPMSTPIAPYESLVETAEKLLVALTPAERDAVFGGAARAAYRLRA